MFSFTSPPHHPHATCRPLRPPFTPIHPPPSPRPHQLTATLSQEALIRQSREKMRRGEISDKPRYGSNNSSGGSSSSTRNDAAALFDAATSTSADTPNDAIDIASDSSSDDETMIGNLKGINATSAPRKAPRKSLVAKWKQNTGRTPVHEVIALVYRPPRP